MSKQLTQEEFITKAKIIHGNKYDYSKTNYQCALKKVIIVCPKHGDFLQTPDHHIRSKSGCPVCSGNKKLTKEVFINRAIKIHGNKYNYDKANYKNVNTKTIIICPMHGEFLQTPYGHLAGNNCPKCSGVGKFTKEEFVKKSTTIHNNRYDYSKVEYINSQTKVIIICQKHGEFLQTPHNHLAGHGCAECFKKKKVTTTEFIKRANQVHSNKYNYNKVIYKNNKSKVIIICPKHGEFLLKTDEHITHKRGCPQCKKNDFFNNFIQKSKKIHSDKYDYSKVVYINKKNKVIIICKKHGEFLQTPNSHLRKSGCPHCKTSKGEIEIIKILDKKNITYIKQKTFNDCRNPLTNWKLFYDFYLPQCNILLEYNGKQHYRCIDYWNHGNTLESQQYRDFIKQQYAINNGYKFLVIKYNDKNIEEILNKEVINGV